MSGRAELLIDLFSGVPAPVAVMAMAALPVAELRLAIPIAIGVYGMSPGAAFGYAVVGNMLPVPVILLLFQKGKELLGGVWPFDKILARVDAKVEAHRESFERWGPPALISFVAVPLPVTGAWTGSAAATVFQVPFLAAVGMLGAGVCCAGGIVTALTVTGVMALKGIQ